MFLLDMTRKQISILMVLKYPWLRTQLKALIWLNHYASNDLHLKRVSTYINSWPKHMPSDVGLPPNSFKKDGAFLHHFLGSTKGKTCSRGTDKRKASIIMHNLEAPMNPVYINSTKMLWLSDVELSLECIK